VTKSDLVESMARAAGGSKTSAERAMNAFLYAVAESLRGGRSVTISGFGTFVVFPRAPRIGCNPRTGRRIVIPGAKVPRFRASRSLKSALR
jgi:DNA-binding protein HU-beta